MPMGYFAQPVLFSINPNLLDFTTLQPVEEERISLVSSDQFIQGPGGFAGIRFETFNNQENMFSFLNCECTSEQIKKLHTPAGVTPFIEFESDDYCFQIGENPGTFEWKLEWATLRVQAALNSGTNVFG